jgi:teichuronic acid exporter
MVSGTLLTRVASFATQILLASILLDDDFGVYAISISIYMLFNAFKDAGTGHFLTHKGINKIDLFVSSAFYLSFFANLIILIIIIIIAPYISDLYGDERIIGLLNILAVSILLRTPANLFNTYLSVQHRFNIVTKVTVISTLLKLSSWILLSFLGYGAYSFVIALPFLAIFESILMYRYARCDLVFSKLWFGQLKTMFKAWGWVALINLGTVLFQNGDYLIFGLFLTTSVVGSYYFSFEILAQIGALIATNLEKVLFPTLSNLEKLEEKRKKVLDTTFILIMFGAYLSVSIGLIIEPISILFGWDEKFSNITVIVQIMAVFFPLRLLSIVTNSTFMSFGEFKKLAAFNLIQSLVILLFIFIAINFNKNIEFLTFVVNVSAGIVTFFFASKAFSRVKGTSYDLFINVFPIWAIINIFGFISWVTSNYIISILNIDIGTGTHVSEIIVSVVIFTLTFAGILITNRRSANFIKLVLKK